MTNYRNPKYLERYEDVYFDLDTSLNLNIANNAHQNRDNIKFIVDNSGEITPFDWYHSRLNMAFQLQLLADGNKPGAAVVAATVNSAFSFINKLIIKMNGIDVYECSDVNHAVNIKNLLEYSKGYSQCQAVNEFFYLDTSRNADHLEFVADAANHIATRKATYNKGFASRKKLLTGAAELPDVNVELPLNRYSFFGSLHNQILPNSRIELQFKFDTDANIMWRATNANGGGGGRLPFGYH